MIRLDLRMFVSCSTWYCDLERKSRLLLILYDQIIMEHIEMTGKCPVQHRQGRELCFNDLDYRIFHFIHTPLVHQYTYRSGDLAKR